MMEYFNKNEIQLININNILEDIIHKDKSYINNKIYNPTGITNLLLSFNFALYNFYNLYYSENFQEECFFNNNYILSLNILENNIQELQYNVNYYADKIKNKYICSIASINDINLEKKVKMYVNFKIKEEITLENTAEFFHLNKIYFCTKFKEEVGINFILYVQKIRIEKAKLLLSQNFLTIEEISQECGFSSAGYFSRVFKKIEGIPPKQYRLNI